MNICKVHRLAEALGVIKRNNLVVFVEPIPFSIVLIDAAENPAVSVKIGELRRLKLFVKFRRPNFRKKFRIAPQPTRRSRFRISQGYLKPLLFARIVLLLRIHRFAVNFIVPPRQSKISRQHVRARMQVANHALARWDRPRENVLYGMARFILRNRLIDGCGMAEISKPRILRRVRRIAIIRINHMARRAAASAIIARMIIRSRQGHHWVNQTRFLQAKKYGIGAQLRSEASIAQLVIGLAGLFVFLRISYLTLSLAATLKNAQHIARLRSFPT